MSKEIPPFRRLPITYDALVALPEYSGTLPTGTEVGKRWRRNVGIFDKIWQEMGNVPYWIVGEFYQGEDVPAGRIGIRWYRPVITVKAISVPA